jgi:soluble lytic murein transglycosylase-like protein
VKIMQTTVPKKRYARRWRLSVLLLSLSLLPLNISEVRGEERLAEIAARSYELHSVKGILGRSAPVRQRQVRRTRVAIPSVPKRAENRRAGEYRALIERYSDQYKLDADLVEALIRAESGGDRLAVSQQGASGLMQLMPATAAEMGVEDIFDPEQNIASGTRYLRLLLDRFQSVEVALWAYNAGPRAVEEGRLPRETEEYIPKVLKFRRSLKAQSER